MPTTSAPSSTLHVGRHLPSGKWALSWLDNHLIGCGTEGETSRKLFDTILEAANYGLKTYNEWPRLVQGIRSVAIYSSDHTMYDHAVKAAIAASDALSIIRGIETHTRNPTAESIAEARQWTNNAAELLEEAARQIRITANARPTRPPEVPKGI